MKRHFSGIISAFFIALCLGLTSCSAVDARADKDGRDNFSANAGESFQKGANILDVALTAPDDEKERKYLGVEKNNTFTISEIDADLVIVEIFSMYCPHCQREAPVVNRLYDKIESSGRDGKKVKIIGIGVGNSVYEVEFFRKSYEIEFPLFPDGEFVVHKKIGSVRTPTFIGVKNRSGGKSEVVYFHVGGIGDPDRFLDGLLKEAGL